MIIYIQMSAVMIYFVDQHYIMPDTRWIGMSEIRNNVRNISTHIMTHRYYHKVLVPMPNILLINCVQMK